jgi:DNA helicase-2/ATP-dependent DNA helicase PcrA
MENKIDKKQAQKELFLSLNEEQLEATQTLEGPVLVLAGAGTGKTKTLVARTINLINNDISGENILVLTFTNKASREMKSRVENIIIDSKMPFMGTFHKFGQILLSTFSEYVSTRKRNFVLIDPKEQRAIVKDIIKDFKLTQENRGNTSSEVLQVINLISRLKNSILDEEAFFLNSQQIENKHSIESQIEKIYIKYEEKLKEKNLIDLDDLLFLLYKMLLEHENIRKKIREKYKYIMIDEFQDTNRVQYEIIKILLNDEKNLFVVGDDDQSIYGWRGAKVTNILQFPEVFPTTKIINLKQNYRSNQKILDIANELIKFNTGRHEKTLISSKSEEINEQKVIYSHHSSDVAEAENVAQNIKKLINSNVPMSDIVVLYRMNSLSFQIERALFSENIKFKIKGKTSLYERAEIKDILNHLGAIANFDNNFNFEKVVSNIQGIGKLTVQRIVENAQDNNLSIFEFLKHVSDEELKKIVTAKKKVENIKKTIFSIIELYEILNKTDKDERIKFINKFEQTFEFKIKYSKNNNAKYSKIRGIDEFYNILETNIAKNKPLNDFIQDYVIDSIESEEEKASRTHITLMSIHLSKGLEFEHVFLVGLDEGVAPLSHGDIDIEEERRLAYVAFTRAKNKLYLSSSKSRTFFTFKKDLKRSRFLYESGVLKQRNEEILEDLLNIKNNLNIKKTSSKFSQIIDSDNLDLKKTLAKIAQENQPEQEQYKIEEIKPEKEPKYKKSKKTFSREVRKLNRTIEIKKSKSSGYKKNDFVKHRKFGTGTVLEVKKDGNTILKIRFSKFNSTTGESEFFTKDIISTYVEKI